MDKQTRKWMATSVLAGAFVMTLAAVGLSGQTWRTYRTGHGSGPTKETACEEAALLMKDFGPDTCVERYRKGLMKDVVASECKCPVHEDGYYHCRIEYEIICEAK